MDIEMLKEMNEQVEKAYTFIEQLEEWQTDISNHLALLGRFIDEAIAKQQATSEEVADAITQLEIMATNMMGEIQNGNPLAEMNIKAIDLAITALQAYQPWIPVSNVKPEKSGRYIAYVPEHWTNEGHKEGKVIIAYFRELNYEGKRRTWDDGAYAISGEVTHFMPIPEPPKGE